LLSSRLGLTVYRSVTAAGTGSSLSYPLAPQLPAEAWSLGGVAECSEDFGSEESERQRTEP
jgi:hypothetical protein